MRRSLPLLLTAVTLVLVGACGSVTEQQGTGGAGGSARGGASGSGGGVGGTPGSAGRGGGGQGGKPTDGGESCDQLVTDYANAVVAARACTPGATNQCMQLAAPVLTTCSACPQYVNDATQLTAIRAQWMAQGCLQPILCPQIACVLPGPSTCVSTSPSGDAGAGAGGTCALPGPLPAN